jgi:hypothetical protein
MRERVGLNEEELISHLTTKDIEALAALEGAPHGVAELAFASFPPGLQQWALTYGLAVRDDESRMKLSQTGWRMIELASERIEAPFADLSLNELVKEAHDSVESLPRPTSGDIALPAHFRMAALGFMGRKGPREAETPRSVGSSRASGSHDGQG